MPVEPITYVLRRELAGTHAELENVSQIPARIKTLDDYIGCLRLYNRIYSPLEAALGAVMGWENFGIDFESRRRLPALRADLQALDVPIADTKAPMPAFNGFPEAAGALYVLEGSVLGGRYILHSLRPVLGKDIAGASRFFEGRGNNTSALWLSFKSALDLFGRNHQADTDRVFKGAKQCFGIFASAFAAHWQKMLHD